LIKINLNPSSTQSYGSGKSSNKLASSLTLETFNPVIWIFCLVVGLAPGFIFESDWKEEQSIIQKKISEKQAELKDYQEKMKELAQYKKTRDRLKEEEALIEEGLSVVGEVLKQKNNPMRILTYIAENIPKDVWLSGLRLDGGVLTLEGFSLNFKSIDRFLVVLNQSLFFEQSARLENYVTKQLNGMGRRVEEFTLKADIERYE